MQITAVNIDDLLYVGCNIGPLIGLPFAAHRPRWSVDNFDAGFDVTERNRQNDPFETISPDPNLETRCDPLLGAIRV